MPGKSLQSRIVKYEQDEKCPGAGIEPISSTWCGNTVTIGLKKTIRFYFNAMFTLFCYLEYSRGERIC